MIHLVDRPIDFLQTGRLFAIGLNEGGDTVADAVDLLFDLQESIAGLVHQPDARGDLLARNIDQVLDFLCRVRRSLGEFPNFLRDNRKTLARLAARAASTPAFNANRFV